jgi:ATP-dependent exoDNAse (exonuclease V) alpha subunit
MNYKQILDQAQQTFPKPVLEHSEQTQYMEELKKQNEVLGSYDWVDQKNGVVRIPIERAMDLLAQRGLPVISQGDAARAAGENKTTGGQNTMAPAPQKAKATKGQQ